MPIDPAIVGATLPSASYQWSWRDVALYHLGLGAGADPTSDTELRYVYESDPVVLPSFAVVPGYTVLGALPALEGLDINWMLLLHGEQSVTVHEPLPAEGEATVTGRVAHLWDKGRSAVLVVEADLASDGRTLATTQSTLVLRGEGGFGGDAGPPAGDPHPDRAPDVTVEVATLPQQALLYRLSGDLNPLHADPGVAALAGFDRPILHGLCTYGIALKAVVDALYDGDPTAVRGWRARFAGPVLPGETLRVRMWRSDDDVHVTVDAPERDTTVLTHATVSG